MSASTLFYAAMGGVFPSLIWLWFWLREDSANPEPRWLLAGAFFSGFLAVIAAALTEKYIAGIVSDSSLRYALWAAAEEIFKFIAVGAIALSTDYNDEPIDAMIYCIVAALGFAAIENTLFLITPIAGGTITQGIVTGDLRFIGATLVHIVSSATVGFAVGFTMYRAYSTRIIAVIVGLSAAIALHAAFNISIINSESSGALQSFTWVWGAVVILMILFEEIKAVRPTIIINSTL